MSGWTYMAACGLHRNENPDEGVVLCLAEFASDMISALRTENRLTFQTFKLRVGKCCRFTGNQSISAKISTDQYIKDGSYHV